MERVQIYFRENSEQVFALAIMWSVVGVIYFLPYKLTFLNVYFLVISRRHLNRQLICILYYG